ncbi:hypothetical protein VNI00_000913 [Paramarasmius palmivorus]|uniref:Uncharacterized protein n=1 Tax=Paramarasmius palmivorus TaxID=297713 RepID=A0AAW0E8N3_9AGAR
MPRIRKKTSKRGTTHERRRLQERIKESKRKKTKEAKKNPQWKSKHKKDPGIPNTFPYKDQILAEVAEQRRLAAEEKQRRKDAKKGILANQAEEEPSDNEIEVDDEAPLDDDKEEDTQGVGSISAKRIAGSRVKGPIAPIAEDDDEDDEDDVPILINRDLPNLQSVIDQADVIVQLLDARDPFSFRSSHLEKVTAQAGKKLLFVLTKIDACPRESVEAWAAVLRKEHPTLLFRAATSFLPGNARVPADVKGKAKAHDSCADALGLDIIQQHLGDLANKKGKDDSLTVAVVGVANVGKSSFVNSLSRKASLPIYDAQTSSRGPTTTSLPQEVTIEVDGSSVRIIDTPGFSWEWEEGREADETSRTRSHDILIRNRGRIDRLKDPSLPVTEIVTRSNPEDLMLLYNLPIFPPGDVQIFLSGVARSQQLVQKRGHLDIAGASRIVLRDWNTGKLRWYCAPSSKGVLAGSTMTDEAVLSSLTPKRDLRKAGGLVKLTAGKIDDRKLSLEESYAAEVDDSDDDPESDDGDKIDIDNEDQAMPDGNDGSEEDQEAEDEAEDELDGSEAEDEEEAPPPSTTSKRKRTVPVALPPNKKVAFTKNGKLPKPATIPTLKSKAPVKSAMKKGATNATSSKTKPKAVISADDGETYDFGKYF